jgi:hypothetical protein
MRHFCVRWEACKSAGWAEAYRVNYPSLGPGALVGERPDLPNCSQSEPE